MSSGQVWLLRAWIALALIGLSNGWRLSTPWRVDEGRRRSSVGMGRASVVRAETKGKTDAAKSKVYCRYGKMIVNCAKRGGVDLTINRELAALISDAKDASVPNDIIRRNLEKVTSYQSTGLKESLFEFIAPGGAMLLVNVQTDNDNRATADVAAIGKQHSLKSASKGSALFHFTKMARLDVSSLLNEDSLTLLCLEHAIDDFYLKTECDGNLWSPTEEGESSIFVKLNYSSILRDVLRNNGYQVKTSVQHLPKEGLIQLSSVDQCHSVVDATEDFMELFDVTSVEHNVDLAHLS